MAKKRALITGITGFVGSHLADYLLANTDFEIFGLIRTRSPLRNISHLIDRINRGDRAHLVYGDLNDSVSIDRLVEFSRPDYVFHLAAQSFPQFSFTVPVEAIETNTKGTLRLLSAISVHKPKAWVHICSSSEVYGKVALKDIPIAECHPFHPASPYAISKVGADLLGQHYAEAYDMNVMVTRMFTHTGPRRGDIFAESSFAKQIAMIEAGHIDPPVIKVGNLNSIRTITDVRDAVRAYYTMLVEHPKKGAVYNIGSDRTVSVGDILNFMIKSTALPLRDLIKVVEDPSRMRLVDADLQIPNCNKFTADTGWQPEISYKQTMTDLLNYWRERVNVEEELLIR